MQAETALDREATADERTGIDWWNSRSEQARAYWLKKANSAVPAEAWAAYQAEPAVRAKPYRALDGIRIDGRDLSVTVGAMADGLLHVLVDAAAGATGYGSACRLTGEGAATAFPLEGIRIDADELQCYAPCRSYPLYQEGFKVPLEPHMAEQLQQWLPRLARSAALALSMAEATRQALPQDKPVAHMESFTSELAALVVLDALTPDAALASLRATHWAAKEEEFVAVFRNAALQQLLANAASEK